MVFHRLYNKLPEKNTDGIKRFKVFFLYVLSICKFLNKFITDRLEIIDKSFFWTISIRKPINKIFTNKL
jgi:hypothetical protein